MGLLGGIAAGKSHVAGLFAGRGFAVLDADAEARAVVADPAVRQEIVARFGSSVLGPGGELDRAALGRIVFADPAARRDLEFLVHPGVRARLLDGIDRARAAGRGVVLDVPLLLEGGLIAHCDSCVFLDAPDSVRAARAQQRGWTEAEWAAREAAQAPLADKRARCVFTVPTGGTREETRIAVDRVIDSLERARR
ncbi:MAG: dephospho-CoA kinase [Planctomycetes bacterium]|nr:dephospho-CoA kinase [Planctomycetota bacterium]MCB9870450.1 dephospho-CoA kinase [Planctomycetota bacterium]